MPGDRHAQIPLAAQRSRGFTLMEVLVALGIFALGMIAVASVFPVAILLQKETIGEVESKQFRRNAEEMVKAVGFVGDLNAAAWLALDNDGSATYGVAPLPQDAYEGWSILDRSYNAMLDRAIRRVFWVPLIYDANPTPGEQDWRVFVFTVRSRGNYYYDHTGPAAADIADGNMPSVDRDATFVPAVCRSGMTTGMIGTDHAFITADPNDVSLLAVGDQIVTNQGIIYSIKGFDSGSGFALIDGSFPSAPNQPTYFWFADPGYDGPGGPRLTSSSFVNVKALIHDPDELNIIRQDPYP